MPGRVKSSSTEGNVPGVDERTHGNLLSPGNEHQRVRGTLEKLDSTLSVTYEYENPTGGGEGKGNGDSTFMGGGKKNRRLWWSLGGTVEPGTGCGDCWKNREKKRIGGGKTKIYHAWGKGPKLRGGLPSHRPGTRFFFLETFKKRQKERRIVSPT